MSKRARLILLLAIAVILGGTTGYLLANRNAATPNTTLQPAETSFIGTVGCLKPRDSSGVQNLSCAIGLTADDGTTYGLGGDDPVMTGSIPSGQRVEVTGTLTEQTNEYGIAGVIRVTSVKEL